MENLIHKESNEIPSAEELLTEIGGFKTTIPLDPVLPSDESDENELWIRRRAVLTRAFFEKYPEHEAALTCIHEYWMLMEMQPHLFLSVDDKLDDRSFGVTGKYRRYNFRDPNDRKDWDEARKLISNRKSPAIERVLEEHPQLAIAHWAYDSIIEQIRTKILDFDAAKGKSDELVSNVSELFAAVKRLFTFRASTETPTQSALFPNYWQISLHIAEEALLEAVDALAYVGVREQRRFLKEAENLLPNNKRVQQVRKKVDAVETTFVLSFTDLISGTHVDISDYRGSVVLIDFWATWCEPCLNQIPQLNRLVEKYHDRGLKVIGISCDMPDLIKGEKRYIRSSTLNDEPIELETYVRATAKNHGMDWPICVDKELADQWGVKSIPTVFAVDREGVLRSTNVAGTLSSTVEELLSG